MNHAQCDCRNIGIATHTRETADQYILHDPAFIIYGADIIDKGPCCRIDGDIFNLQNARIETQAALARSAPKPGGTANAELVARHEALRERVSDSIAQLDSLIEGLPQ